MPKRNIHKAVDKFSLEFLRDDFRQVIFRILILTKYKSNKAVKRITVTLKLQEEIYSVMPVHISKTKAFNKKVKVHASFVIEVF